MELDAAEAGAAEGVHELAFGRELRDAVATLVAAPQAAVGEAHEARGAQQSAAGVLGTADGGEFARRLAAEIEDAHAARELVDDQ
ncbi:MAG TPA: hypothetical protein VMT18_13675 [Planctomycetota bacterium]|nr:hypothetical protein [Planctomycetota bacterium]